MKEKTLNLPGYPLKNLNEHTEIVDAINNKDRKSARKAVYGHLSGVKTNMLEE